MLPRGGRATRASPPVTVNCCLYSCCCCCCWNCVMNWTLLTSMCCHCLGGLAWKPAMNWTLLTLMCCLQVFYCWSCQNPTACDRRDRSSGDNGCGSFHSRSNCACRDCMSDSKARHNPLPMDHCNRNGYCILIRTACRMRWSGRRCMKPR